MGVVTKESPGGYTSELADIADVVDLDVARRPARRADVHDRTGRIRRAVECHPARDVGGRGEVESARAGVERFARDRRREAEELPDLGGDRRRPVGPEVEPDPGRGALHSTVG